MIPRIIHRLWLHPPGPPMPAIFRAYGEQWRTLNPGWEVRDWTSLDAFGPLANQQGFDAIRRDLHRYRSSLVRTELLLRYGGVYVDTDMEPLRPIIPLVDGHVCVLAESANRGARGQAVLSDSFIAAEPGHPLLAEVVRTLPAAAEHYRGRHAAVWIGPQHLDRTYRNRTWPGVTVLEPRVLYPQSIAARNAGRPVDLSQCYAWHHWNNTRRDRGRVRA